MPRSAAQQRCWLLSEAPGALHAVSRNGSKTEPVKYLVIQVSDPTKPQTVPE
jgi:hypothetical protein